MGREVGGIGKGGVGNGLWGMDWLVSQLKEQGCRGE